MSKVWLILGVLLSACGTLAAQKESPPIRNIVLVHDAWAERHTRTYSKHPPLEGGIENRRLGGSAKSRGRAMAPNNRATILGYEKVTIT